MPSLKEEILLTLKEGVVYLLNPYALFRNYLPCQPSSLYKTAARLEKDGLVRKSRKERKTYLQLTAEGKEFLLRHKKASQRPQRNWDNKWRLVVFDIPERRGDVRRYFRQYLITLGFGRVQRSVLISPYDFGAKIDHFAKKFEISGCIFQLTVENIRGMSDRELARSCWDMQGLNSEYLEFTEHYSSKLSRLQHIMKGRPEDAAAICKKFKNSLLWDFQSILARDPQLPMELLPPNWRGTAATLFVERCVANMVKFINKYQQKTSQQFILKSIRKD